MLLAQPFDPFKEQQRKLSFFAKWRIISSRTKRALSELKSRMHDNSISNRELFRQALMIPPPEQQQRFLLPSQQIIPPSQPWYHPAPPCYEYCYDPYFSSPPMMLPPPLPLHTFPIPPHHHQQVPYCVCVHYFSSPHNNQYQPSPPTHNYYNHECNNSSSIAESTLYSGSDSSMYSNEKELIEEIDYDIPQHPLQRNSSLRHHQPTTSTTLARRNSDILPNRPGRPSLNRWNTSNSHVYYNF